MRSILLLGAAMATTMVAAPGALAADDSAVMRRLDQMQKMIEAQQKQIEVQKKEIQDLKGALSPGQAPAAEPVAAPPLSPSGPPVVETRLKQQDQKIDDLVAKFAAEQDSRRAAEKKEARASVPNGRLTVTSADGRFSAALRVLGQYDMGYFMQSARARSLSLGPDLSSGSNFPRARLGIQGKVFGDWSYFFNYDFGSGGFAGTETPGKIQQAYIEYDGLKPFAFRIGAHPPSTGLDDSYSPSDSLFLERSSPGSAARGMAGGNGRDSIELLYRTDRVFGSLAYTGGKIQQSGLFDEQQALVGRVAYSAVANQDWRWVVSLAATDVFRPGDASAALDAPRPFSISNPPELNVDDNSTKFVSASAANVTDAWNLALESAVTYHSLLAQGGYFRYGMDLRGVSALRGQNFNGWYGEAAWVLTGEGRGWSTATGSFGSPKPKADFDPAAGGWGAWELATRYSSLDLNDNAGVVGAALPAGGIRGGEQRIGSLALNWYPNPVLKFVLLLQNVQVSRIGTNTAVTPSVANADLGQNFDTIALRSQIAF
jgi:phosphate-selective porin OprO and OprP